VSGLESRIWNLKSEGRRQKKKAKAKIKRQKAKDKGPRTKDKRLSLRGCGRGWESTDETGKIENPK
jgi:hypothetical protein